MDFNILNHIFVNKIQSNISKLIHLNLAKFILDCIYSKNVSNMINKKKKKVCLCHHQKRYDYL